MEKLTLPPTNFAQLQEHDNQQVRLGRLAERYFAEDLRRVCASQSM